MAKAKTTRRLAAIFAADMVGYSRLMEANEEGTIARQKAHREELIDPKIDEHNGRIVKTTGDGLLVEFASVVDAVKCAVEVQQAMAEREADVPDDRRIRYRVGINLGDIVIDGDDILGDGVNVAARLEALAAPGEVLISGTAFDQVKKKLDYGYRAEGERKVKNIAEPVRIYGVLPHSVAGTVLGQRRWPARGWRWGAVAAVAALLVALGAVWTFYLREPGTVATTKAGTFSIVVLPFENLSGDKTQDYFALAITEDLITDLSRIRGAFVIARGTSFTYKGKAVNAKTVASELGVRYVLEGSVRRVGGTVRVNAQLIDGRTGGHIWSEKFDRELKDVIALQNDITGHIAAVLRAELLEAESRRPIPASLEAWDYAVRGQVMLHRLRPRPNVFVEAKQLFEKALKLDPNQASAWEGLAFIHYVAATRKLPGITGPHKKLALEAALRAVSIDPKSSGAHTVLGLAYVWVRRPDRALAACETALELNRNNDDAYVCAAQAQRALGKSALAIRMLEKSRKLNPKFRPWRRNMLIGANRVLLGEYDKALIVLNKAKAQYPTHQIVNMYLASALALSGRMDQARKALSEYLKLVGENRNTIEKVRANLGHISPDFERLLEGLRRAGMPEK